jgi:hypothetical protein
VQQAVYAEVNNAPYSGDVYDAVNFDLLPIAAMTSARCSARDLQE